MSELKGNNAMKATEKQEKYKNNKYNSCNNYFLNTFEWSIKERDK